MNKTDNTKQSKTANYIAGYEAGTIDGKIGVFNELAYNSGDDYYKDGYSDGWHGLDETIYRYMEG